MSGLVDEEIKEDVLAAGDLDLENTVKLIEQSSSCKIELGEILFAKLSLNFNFN